MFSRFLFRLALLLTVLYSLAPFLWQVLTSLKPSHEVFSLPPTYWPSQLSLESYQMVFTLRPFARYIGNSMIVASGTALLTISIAILASYALSRFRLKGSQSIQMGLLGIALFPPIVLAVPLYEGIRALGLVNHPLALVLPYSVLNLPFATWALSGFFLQFPGELEDAAKVDGFSRMGILFRVILPISAPVLATTAILVFIFAWNEFLFALTFMTRDAARTVPVGIAMLSGVTVYEVPWDQISAAVVVTTLPVVVVVILFQRWIVHGLTAGAIKG